MADELLEFAEAFAGVAKSIADGELQKQALALRKETQEHKKAAKESEAAEVKAIEATRAYNDTLKDIAKREKALETGKTKLADDRKALESDQTTFRNQSAEEQAGIDAAKEQLGKDEAAAAAILAMQEETNRLRNEVERDRDTYRRRLSELGLKELA